MFEQAHGDLPPAPVRGGDEVFNIRKFLSILKQRCESPGAVPGVVERRWCAQPSQSVATEQQVAVNRVFTDDPFRRSPVPANEVPP
jgi:hypothetical protein